MCCPLFSRYPCMTWSCDWEYALKRNVKWVKQYNVNGANWLLPVANSSSLLTHSRIRTPTCTFFQPHHHRLHGEKSWKVETHYRPKCGPLSFLFHTSGLWQPSKLVHSRVWSPHPRAGCPAQNNLTKEWFLFFWTTCNMTILAGVIFSYRFKSLCKNPTFRGRTILLGWSALGWTFVGNPIYLMRCISWLLKCICAAKIYW